MPSTEFFLFLVIVIFVIFVIMHYYKDNTANQDVQYKYIPVYKNEPYDNTSEKKVTKPRTCNNQYCKQSNKCVCGDDSQNNSTDSYGSMRHGSQASIGLMTSPGPYGHHMGPHTMGPVLGPIGPQHVTISPLMGPMSSPMAPMAPLASPMGPTIAPILRSQDPLRKFDYDAMYDEFTPPFRRNYYDENNYNLNPGLYPTYTRGPPGKFRKIGTLVAQSVATNDKYKFLHLMGREKYPGRDFEYYATSTSTEQRVKFYINTKGKEINDNDIVIIPQLEGYQYRFDEDKDLSPRYDPYTL